MLFFGQVHQERYKKMRNLWMGLLLVLTACATLGDRTVSVSEADIQNMLNKKLDVPIQLLKIFDVSLSNSVVKFDKDTGRMHTTLDTSLQSKLFDESLVGKLGISGKLRFDAATQSIVLDEPQIEQFNIAGADSKQNEMMNALAKVIAGPLLNGLTLYKVKEEDLKFGGTSYTPKNMQVTGNGLQITLSPTR